jgi:hypothetical protein
MDANDMPVTDWHDLFATGDIAMMCVRFHVTQWQLLPGMWDVLVMYQSRYTRFYMGFLPIEQRGIETLIGDLSRAISICHLAQDKSLTHLEAMGIHFSVYAGLKSPTKCTPRSISKALSKEFNYWVAFYAAREKRRIELYDMEVQRMVSEGDHSANFEEANRRLDIEYPIPCLEYGANK